MTWDTSVVPILVAVIAAVATIIAAVRNKSRSRAASRQSTHDPTALRTAPSGPYRVFLGASVAEQRCEQLDVVTQGHVMLVRSPEWESVGLFVNNRFAGRFK